MSSPDLLTVCFAAFTAVFLLLTVLALIMRLIILLFPEKGSETHSAMLAAVAAMYQSLYPGMKITRVEEVK